MLTVARLPSVDEVPELAGRLRREWGLNRLQPLSPSDISKACRHQRSTVKTEKLNASDGGLQGLMIPNRDSGRIRIIVDPAQPGDELFSGRLLAVRRRRRRRFLICHELAHTVLPLLKGPGFLRSHPELEARCDQLAAALLLPPEAVQRQELCPETIVSLERRFDVEAELVLRSMIDIHSAPAWLLHTPSANHPEDLSVKWGSTTTSKLSMPWEALRRGAQKTRSGRGRVFAEWKSGGRARIEFLKRPRLGQMIAIGSPLPA